MTTAALVAGCAAVSGLLGLLVPWLVRRLPEPERDESVEGEPAKPLYSDLAARSGLAWRSAAASAAAGAVLAAAVGEDWWLVVLVPLVPVCVTLALIDWSSPPPSRTRSRSARTCGCWGPRERGPSMARGTSRPAAISWPSPDYSRRPPGLLRE
jgi:hypothetical protein